MDMLESMLLPYGYHGLFLASFLASTIFPLGSEAFVILLITKNFNIYYVILVASVGNFLGACTSYYIGFAGRMHIIEKYFGVSKSQLERAEKWFTKYGSWSLLFTWLPIVGDALPMMAGIMKLRFVMFSILVFIGKFLRYAVLAYIIYAGKGLLE
ncbi:MAG TPA: YqaA family protein [Candidatus Nanoarchaeia archaeon]|nr:YqaA family protein [Candidatus Nanoarchaeia archaeon]